MTISFGPELLENDLGTALSVGRLVVTYTGSDQGHITVQFKTWKRGDRRKRVPIYDADRIYIDVPSPSGWQFNDKIGWINLPQGEFIPERTADPARVEAARVILAAARGLRDESNILRPETCMVCGRELTHPESIRSRIGPECAKRGYNTEHQTKLKQIQANGSNGAAPKVKAPANDEIHITLSTGNHYRVDFRSRFTREALAEMKSTTSWQNRSYDSYTKSWWVEITPANAKALLDLAAKYNLTVDSYARTEMEREASEQKPDLKIDYQGNKLIVTFEFGPNFEALLNGVQGIETERNFNRDKKQWEITPTHFAAAKLYELCERFPYHVTDEAATILKPLRERAEREAKGGEIRAQLSRAEEADLDLGDFGYDLRPFQNVGVVYGEHADWRYFIADEQGLGKTVEALAAAVVKGSFPLVVVTPSNVKVKLSRMVKKALPWRTVEIVEGQKPHKVDADVIVINWDILSYWVPVKKDVEMVEGKKVETITAHGPIIDLNPKGIVYDESQHAKNYKAKRTIAAQALSDATYARHGDDALLVNTTGTPVLNRPMEWVAQIKLIQRLDDFGGFKRFVTRYVGWANDGYATVDPDGAKNLGELNEKLRKICYVRRLKKDVLPELPEKQRDVIPMEISRKGWKSALKDSRSRLTSDSGYADHLAEITFLRQEAARLKLDSVISWVRDFLETGEKLVVFAYHQEIQQALLEAFPEALSILASKFQSKKKRQENMDRFQDDPDAKLVICSLMSAKEGIDLFAASNLAFVELGWNPGVHDQAEDRIHRIGQDRGTMMYYLLAEDTIDERMAYLIETKREIVKASTDNEPIDPDAGQASMVGDLIKWLQEEEEVAA